jgi:ABC-type uncharacterized transport system auxiliary subunit
MLLLLCSCTSLSKPFPAKESFGITVPDLAPAGPSPVHDAVLRIDRVRIVPPFDQRTFVYRLSDTRFEYDYYAEFIAPPDRLLTTQFIHALASAGIYRTVIDSDASIDTPLRLETTVTELSTNFGVTPAAAVIRARVLLLNDALHATDVLAEWELEASEPVTGQSPAAIADALSRAAAGLVAELASRLAAAPAQP